MCVCIYLQPDSVMEDADKQDVLHQESVRHQWRGDAGCEQHLRQGVIHVLPAAAHVELLQLTADGRHVGLTQPGEERKWSLLKETQDSAQMSGVIVISTLTTKKLYWL